MEAPARRRSRRRSRTRRSRCSARSSTADPAHYVRGQYDGYRDDRRRRAGLDDRDVRRAAARHRELALVGRALLHPRPGSGCRRTQTELRLVFKHPPQLGFGLRAAEPEPDQLVIKLDPSTGDPDRARRAPRRRAGRRADHARHGVRRAGRRGRRRPTRCCCTPRWSARARASPARTASRRRGGSCSRCSTPRRRCSRTRRAPGGPTAADAARRGPRRLARALGDA